MIASEDTLIAPTSFQEDKDTLPGDWLEQGRTRLPPDELLQRYEDVRFLGEGTTGTLYRAKDPRLGRTVALKLLKSDDPLETHRFLREAQAQARVQHEHVCRVYEVGEAAGTPFIVMELIDGEPLDRAQLGMTLEQKVKIIREVAAALHEAHRLGLIHRDVKPGNIMVALTEEGDFKPYVVDFGLARDIASTGASTQNGIVGTPAYMSPEQAEGNTAVLDRRTDVYSLGATLYDLIAGRTPFVGSNALTLLTKVMYEDAPALGKIRKGVPKPLETVVMTCLQRDPGRRYESARALGDDLQRFLDGGEVQAKRQPWAYVLAQKARRNKALVIVVAIGLCLTGILGGMWIQSAQRAAKEAELARELGEDIKYVELFLRSAYGMPVHDIEREQRVVRIRLVNIARRMVEVGRIGQGPGHYALGRGHLALHDYEEAQNQLEASLASGYEKPEVHYALGLALGERYQAALDDARRIGDSSAREAAIRNAESRFREPALQHLRTSGGTEVESQTYIEGLVAFYEKRYDDAAQKSITAMQEAPWFYEAKKLEGDARFAAGILASESGHKEEGYRLLHMSVAEYGEAAAIATSDSSVHEALATAWIQILKMQTWDSVPHQHAFAEAIKACDDAVKANPVNARPLSKKSQAYCHMGQFELRSGIDPRATFRQAIDAGLQARQIAANDAISADGIGTAFTFIAKYERKIGLNPIANLNEGIANFDVATRIQPTFAWAWNDAGIAYRVRAEYEAEHGLDPDSSIESGLARFRRAAAEDPHYALAHGNLAYILWVSATYDLSQGRDPRPDIKIAVESSIRGTEINPQSLPNLNNRGWAELAGAQYEENIGEDPSKTLDNVEKSFQSSMDLNKEEADTHFGMGSAKHLRARHQIRNGVDPERHLDEARTYLQRAAELDAQEPNIRLELGQLYLTMASRAFDAEQDPAPLLATAEKVFRDGLHINSRHAPLHAALAELLGMRAEQSAKKSAEKEKWIAEGLSEANDALTHNPKWALAFATRGILYALRAEMKKDGAKAEDQRLAQEWFDQALAINAHLPPRFKRRFDALRHP
ncbi:MAG TPA: protein kinase [Polyangium sp.]|nr:protein kinase [Polyangium sp.]